MAMRMLAVQRACAVAGVFALVSSCGPQPYSKFYSRYAGTCDRTPAQPAAAEYIPNLAPIKREFIQTLDEHEAQVRQCYVDALRYGETHGTIELAVSLEPDGHADPVTVSSDSTSFAPLACCVVSVVNELSFGSTGERVSVSFEYPFSFRTVRMQDAENARKYRSTATKTGFIVELDESSIVIGGNTLRYTSF
jgi:hypothetical protein